MTSLPGKSGNCWLARAKSTDYPMPDRSIHAETVVPLEKKSGRESVPLK